MYYSKQKTFCECDHDLSLSNYIKHLLSISFGYKDPKHLLHLLPLNFLPTLVDFFRWSFAAYPPLPTTRHSLFVIYHSLSSKDAYRLSRYGHGHGRRGISVASLAPGSTWLTKHHRSCCGTSFASPQSNLWTRTSNPPQLAHPHRETSSSLVLECYLYRQRNHAHCSASRHPQWNTVCGSSPPHPQAFEGLFPGRIDGRCFIEGIGVDPFPENRPERAHVPRFGSGCSG